MPPLCCTTLLLKFHHPLRYTPIHSGTLRFTPVHSDPLRFTPIHSETCIYSRTTLAITPSPLSIGETPSQPLMRCGLCPVAMHHSCALKALGQKPGSDLAVGVGNSWACPHHQCATCGRKAAAAGGLLFRCISCPQVPSPNRPSPKTTTLTLNLNLSLTLTLCGD